MPFNPLIHASNAIDTVPLYKISVPTLLPIFIPPITKSNIFPNLNKANFVQSAGVPEIEKLKKEIEKPEDKKDETV